MNGMGCESSDTCTSVIVQLGHHLEHVPFQEHFVWAAGLCTHGRPKTVLCTLGQLWPLIWILISYKLAWFSFCN